jgi:hypothetical protein
MKGTFVDFLQLVVDTPELAKGLEELAASFDFEFSGELSDAELENVAGGLTAGNELQQVSETLPTEQDASADTVMSAGQLAAPYIPGGAVVSAAISGLGQLKNSLGA